MVMPGKRDSRFVEEGADCAAPDISADVESEAEDDEEWRTGHDLHFLSRLNRADSLAVERALRLYRDSALTRTILARVPRADSPAVGEEGAAACGDSPEHVGVPAPIS